MAKRGPDFIDPRLIKATEHPLRIEILTVLREGPSSPARIQRQLEGASLNLVSHHMKVLKELGCIELIETVTRRGAKESVYREAGPFVISDELWAKLTPKVRLPVVATVLRLISNDLAGSLGSGKFEDIADNHLSRTPLQLDKEGRSEVVDLLSRTLEEVLEIATRSLKRSEANNETPTPTTVAIMQFPTVEKPGEGLHG